MLKEQDLIRNELLERYEKRNEEISREMEFFKEQNNELIKRLDEFDLRCIVAAAAENDSVMDTFMYV